MFEEIKRAIAEVQQPRSKFQIERFVLGQHATPEMQYYQTVIELQDLLYKYELAKIGIQKTEAKIAKLLATGDEIDALKAKEKELGLKQTELAMLGAKREIEHLMDIWNSFEHKYTREEIESAQPDYWQARLTGNARAMIMSGGGLNPAHLEAMGQAGVLESFISEIEQSKKEIV